VPLRTPHSAPQSGNVIRNVVIHLLGDQPVVVDLVARPQSSDASLICLNLRTIDGKRPPSVHEKDSLFLIPLATVRFIEIPARSLASDQQPDASADDGVRDGGNGAQGIDHRSLPVVLPARELELEPDEDLLRRIRDV
ncbi:MAG: hypothetical protein M3253_05325, partial [Chloroflexota bacterium]|nr:hypothetical protein [Chloroflexota bacterium]